MNLSPLALIPQILAILALAAFVPLTAVTYYRFSLRQRRAELDRILDTLGIDRELRQVFDVDVNRRHFFAAVAFSTALSVLGLGTLFLGYELRLAEVPSLLLGGARFPATDVLAGAALPVELLQFQQGALLVFSMAFLGAYLWALQNLLRRHAVNDLSPSAYYNVGVRMIFAAVFALLLYHLADAFGDSLELAVAPGGETGSGGHTASLLPALAFFIGMFPQRGIRWLRKRFTALSEPDNPTVREMPLSMIEGMSIYDRLRFDELGVDSCYDLANIDFIPYLLKTPYTARQLIDWILQAKLCIHFGETVRELRDRGVRTLSDLERLEEEELKLMAQETALTEPGLRRAKAWVESDEDIRRLRAAATLLSRYWKGGDAPAPAGETARAAARPLGKVS